MSRELSKIFDVKSRQARRDILDKFDLSKEDKNKVLNKIDSAGGETGGGGSGSGSGDEYIIYYSFGEATNIYKINSNDEVKYSILGVRTAWSEINADTYMYGSYNAMN